MISLLALVPVYFAIAAFGTVLPRGTSVQLAISPPCGSSQDFSTGIPSLSSMKTIVAFGDSYTDGGAENGGPLPPAVVVPPNPEAGGRMSNGPVWVENLAKAANATLKDYAMSGALVDATQYPGVTLPNPNARDFFGQINMLLSQPSIPDPATTLYVVFFGMGDFIMSDGFTKAPGPDEVVSGIMFGILELVSSPIFAKNILIVDNYGRGTTTAAGQQYKADLYSGAHALGSKFGVNVAFADLSNIWNAVLGPNPGYAAFGYTSPGACVSNVSTVGECADPDHTFYWMPGNPSKVTHQLIANYVSEVIAQC